MLELGLEQYIQYALALFFVLALIGLLFWVLKRFGGSKIVNGGRGRRLGVSEAAAIDKQRRLVLVRRDNREHLIMIGGPQDVVIESGIDIPSAQTHPRETIQAPDYAPEPAREPARAAPRQRDYAAAPADDGRAAPRAPEPPQPAQPQPAAMREREATRASAADRMMEPAGERAPARPGTATLNVARDDRRAPVRDQGRDQGRDYGDRPAPETVRPEPVDADAAGGERGSMLNIRPGETRTRNER